MTVTIEYTFNTKVPVEVEGITPCRCRGLSLSEIKRLPVYHGNESVEFGALFQVRGSAENEHWVWEGDLAGVHWLGTGLASGTIDVRGNIGRHLGSSMSGGSISVTGNAGDWVGGEMQGGRIVIAGDAGHLVGAAYRGSAVGMAGGWILVNGSAGNEIGHTMRRGLIAIGGGAGDLIGFNMLAGTILVFGTSGIRHGAGMTRGTIGLLGEPAELLPTFTPGGQLELPMMEPLYRRLESFGFTVPSPLRRARLQVYHGDLLEGGRGEILMTSSA